MVIKTVDVECDLDDFSDDELLAEINLRGISDIRDINIDDLITETERRGFTVVFKESSEIIVSEDAIYNLYYDHIEQKDFDKKLKEFFFKTLGK